MSKIKTDKMNEIKVVANGITMAISTNENSIIIKPVTDLENWQMYSFGICKNQFTADYLIQKINEISKSFANMQKDN